MDRRTLIIILGLALLVGFFLPYILNVSGFDLVKAKDGDWTRFILLLIPISGLVLLLGSLDRGGRIRVSSFWTWLPLLTIIFFIFLMPLIEGVPFGSIFENFGKGWGVGLWITIVAALILAFYRPRVRRPIRI